MPGISGTMGKKLFFEPVTDMFADNSSAQRQVTAGQSFGHRHDVGHHIPVIHGKPFAGPAESAHHLIGDHENAPLVAHLSEFGKILGWRHDNSVGAGHRLKNNPGHLPFTAFQFDDFIYIFDALQITLGIFLPKHAPVAIRLRYGHQLCPAQHLGPATGIARRKRHGGGCTAMVGPIAGQHLPPPGKLVTDLDRRLVGFRPAQGNKRSGQIARCDFCQHLTQQRPRFGGKTRSETG